MRGQLFNQERNEKVKHLNEKKTKSYCKCRNFLLFCPIAMKINKFPEVQRLSYNSWVSSSSAKKIRISIQTSTLHIYNNRLLEASLNDCRTRHFEGTCNNTVRFLKKYIALLCDCSIWVFEAAGKWKTAFEM